MFFLHFVSDGWMGLALEVDWFLFFFFILPLRIRNTFGSEGSVFRK